MPRAMKVCSVPGCPEAIPAGSGGRCTEHNRAADRARGNYEHRGGGNARAWRAARRRCLLRDPLCVCTDEKHGHKGQCMIPATVADHWPVSKRDLVAQGVADPDALERLRGLCARCHNKSSAALYPGGWNARL